MREALLASRFTEDKIEAQRSEVRRILVAAKEAAGLGIGKGMWSSACTWLKDLKMFPTYNFSRVSEHRSIFPDL